MSQYAENVRSCRAIGHLSESLGQTAKPRGQLTASLGT